MLPKQLIQHLAQKQEENRQHDTRHIMMNHALILMVVAVLWIGPFYVGQVIAWDFPEHARYYIYGLALLSMLYILHIIFYWKLHRSKS